MSTDIKSNIIISQELSLASKALDWLFNNFRLLTDFDNPLILMCNGENKLAVFRTNSGLEIIIGKSDK